MISDGFYLNFRVTGRIFRIAVRSLSIIRIKNQVFVLHIDCLAFSPHPDDAELFCSGFLLKSKTQGLTTAIVDLTRGELSSNGDPQTRADEAEKASNILKLDLRKNLHLSDGNIENNVTNRKLVIEVVRELRPKISLVPYWQDRHPDHIAAAKLVRDAIFYAGLRKIESAFAPYRPEKIIYYMLHKEFGPNLILDITEEMAQKLEAINAFSSQFSFQEGQDTATYINQSGFIEGIKARAAFYGRKIGAAYGEPYYYDGALKIDNIPQFFA